MRRLLVVIAALIAAPCFGQSAPNMFTQPGLSIIGVGCTTSVYLDQGCKPCGPGVKSGGTYPNAAYPWGTYPSPYTPASPPDPNTAAWYTMGDSPDPDPTDPTLGCSSAAWEARYGWIYAPPTTSGQAATDNAAMVAFLISRKGYSNLGWGCTGTSCTSPAVYYVSQSGVDANCESGSVAIPNRPDIPCYTLWPILNALATKVSSFTGQGNFTDGSNVLTISSCSPCGLSYNMQVTGTGMPAGDFYILAQLSGTTGGVGTYAMGANAASTQSTETITGSHFPGGAIIVEAGTWTPCPSGNTNACLRFTGSESGTSYYPTGSPGYPLYVLAFPGSVVQQQNETDDGGASGAHIAPVCCTTWDGIQFLDPQLDEAQAGGAQGNALSYTNATNIIIINDEFAGWDKIFFGNSNSGIVIQGNVFHEMYAHAIYFAYSATDCTPAGALYTTPGDVNFAAYQAAYLATTGCGPSFAARIIGNLIYDGGAVGYDSIHLNTFMDAPVVSGNIISYVGGAPIGLQTGVYNALIMGNLMFDFGDNCYIPFIETPATPNSPASLRWNSFNNNVCWSGPTTDYIWGIQPSGGIYQTSAQTLPNATYSNGSDILTITTAAGNVGSYNVITATGIPQARQSWRPGCAAVAPAPVQRAPTR